MNPQYSQKVKTLLLLLILVLIILGVAGGAFFYLKQNRADTPTTGDSIDDQPTSFKPINTTGGAGKGAVQGSSTQATSTSTGSNIAEQPKVSILVATPVAGAVSTTTPSGLVVRYVDKATGHVFQIDNNSINPSRITNTTLPKALNVSWSSNGGDLLFTYIRQNNSQVLDTFMHINDIFLKTTKPATTSNASSTMVTETPTTTGLLTVKTSMVGNNNQSIALSPSGKKIFYIKDDGSGSNQKYGVYTSNSDGGAISRVWSTSIGGWVLNWVREGNAKEDPLIAMYVKPISMGTGFGYLFNPKTRNLEKVGQGGKGFTMTVNPSVTYAITSTTEDNQIGTNFVNIKTNTSTIAPFRTLPEKCAWSRINEKVAYCAVPNDIRSGEYPESWYMGDVTFTDRIWKVNVETGLIEKLSDLLNDTGELVDATNLNVAPNDEYLTFIKKDDSSLWMLNLK